MECRIDPVCRMGPCLLLRSFVVSPGCCFGFVVVHPDSQDEMSASLSIVFDPLASMQSPIASQNLPSLVNILFYLEQKCALAQNVSNAYSSTVLV